MKKGVIIAGSGRGSAFAKMILKEGRRRVIAMVDTNTALHEKLRKRFTEEYGSPETDIITNLEEALAKYPKEAADAVFIVTPNNTHAELLRQALEAGRHVMLEKPLAADMEDLKKIGKLRLSYPDQIIHLGFGMRYGVLWRKVAEIVKSGRIGKVCMIQTNEWIDFAHSGNAYRRGWRRSQAVTGGFLNEKCSHDLDFLCELKQKEADPVKVYSVAGRQMFQKEGTPERCSLCSDAACPFRWKDRPSYHYQLAERDFGKCVFRTDADVFNIQSVTLTFSDGTQAIHTLLPYTGLSPRRFLFVHGTDGFLHGQAIEDEGLYLQGTFYRESGMKQIDFPLEYDRFAGHGGSDENLLKGFFDSLDGLREPDAEIYDGIRASLIAFSADESALSGEAVNLRPRLAEFESLRGIK